MLTNINITRAFKKAISIFLIFLLGFNTFGLFFFYWSEIQLCKIRADEFADADCIPAKTLTVFSANVKNFELIDKREIRCNDKLYDIVKTQKSNGTTVYYAISDHDEDNYVQDLKELEKNNGEQKSMPGKTIDLPLAKYFTPVKYCHPVFVIRQLSNKLETASDHFFYKSPLKNIFSPPPDVIIS